MGEKCNQRRNQKVSGNKQKWTHNNPNPVGHSKGSLRGKFIAIQAYLKRIDTAQINNLTVHLQQLEGQQQRQPRSSTRKEITKIRAELYDIETKSTIQRIN